MYQNRGGKKSKKVANIIYVQSQKRMWKSREGMPTLNIQQSSSRDSRQAVAICVSGFLHFPNFLSQQSDDFDVFPTSLLTNIPEMKLAEIKWVHWAWQSLHWSSELVGETFVHCFGTFAFGVPLVPLLLLYFSRSRELRPQKSTKTLLSNLNGCVFPLSYLHKSFELRLLILPSPPLAISIK